MSLKGRLVGKLNKALSPSGIAITKIGWDFDSRLCSPAHLRSLHQGIAAPIATWFASQSTFEFEKPLDVEQEVAAFYELFLAAPFRDQSGGSRFNNALWLHLIAKALAPRLIIDSGTHRGTSAWALSSGSPSSRLLSFDIDLSHLRKKMPGCTYLEHDWSEESYSNQDAKSGLCYFDDHIDQARRLIEAHERGFAYAIFDDDYPVSSFAPSAHDSAALPKIEFILDKSLRDNDDITWSTNGKKQSWRIDKSYLERARATIAATERLPNTSLVTGIHQTPYRVVRFAT
jgi:hypothetical protein